MRIFCSSALTLALLAAGASLLADTGAPDQPPQLLGVWHGEYDVETEGAHRRAEMWMEVSWQLSEDGWDVKGHNRWNVSAASRKGPRDEASDGHEPERFDTFSGRIAPDRQTVHFTEDHGGTIEATLTAPDTLEATFRPGSAEADSAGFRVTLKRIDTHYRPSDPAVLGIDVSHHSGEVDWSRVEEQGYRFAYVKSSEGVDNPDAMFEKHWRELKGSGLRYGAYHFYVTEDDPVEQAEFFASRLSVDSGTLPPAVDVELLGAHTTGDMTETLLTFLRTLEQAVGVTPVIYTSPQFWDSHFRPEFSAYPLWLAEYGVVMPKVPFGWNDWLLWQRVENKQVEGVEQGADVNLLHPDVDLDTLRPNG